MLRVRVLPGLNGERDIRGTEDMRRIISFFQESYAELKKVTWPSREEALASTRVVLVSTILIALMLGAVDFILFKLVDWVF
jgi:preprotein translocase subunit SecE